MSLRRRFLLLLCLAVVALGAALLAVLQLRARSATQQEAAAFDQADAVVEALLRRLESRPSSLLEAGGPEQVALRGFVALLIAPLVDASAGYCASDGTLLFTETVAPPRSARPPLAPPPAGASPGARGDVPPAHAAMFSGPPTLLPLDRDVVREACRVQRAGQSEHVRFLAPSDILLVSVRGSSGSVAAWALVRLSNRIGEETGGRWTLIIGSLVVLALLLVVLTAEALWVLRRGSEELQQALVRLPQDLRTEVPRPMAEELARLAEGLRAMARQLIEARERERRLERRLGQEQRLASLGRVVAGVAHEVRNPLAGMKLTLDGMVRRRLDERSHGDVAICLEEIARLERVVGSLLLVSHKGPPAKSALDLAVLADERLRAAEALTVGRGLRLVRQGRALGWAHREQLTRVIDNLVRNAIEASPRGAEVRIELDTSEQGARLAVVDQGPGVPPERQGELFEPFFTLKPEGTGLGLFLSRSLVDAHGGMLAYERAPGETRFVITLPEEGPHAWPAPHPRH
jgi:signal transduction histidine kinase